MSKIRNACVTINNYTEEHIQHLDSMGLCTGIAKYVVYGKEVGKSGTPHLQIYLEFNNPVSMKNLKNRLSCPHAHIEPRMGTSQQASDYCKKDGDFKEYGTLSKQGGNRSDVSELADSCQEGKTIREIAEDYPGMFIKYHKGVIALRSALTQPRDANTPKEVIVRYGPTESGKSRICWLSCPDLYKWGSANEKWWDGYDGHTEVMMEEFRGDLPFKYLIDLIDRYPIKVAYKGGMVEFVADTIMINSPIHPSQWYDPTKLRKNDSMKQLKRRITYIYRHVEGDESGYDAVDETDQQWPPYDYGLNDQFPDQI